MAKRKGNPNWGKSPFAGPATEPDRWDAMLDGWNIPRDDKQRILRSARVREFVFANYNSRFVPTYLLDHYGLTPVVTYD